MKHHKLGFLVIFVSSLVILSTPAIHAAEYDILATITVGSGPSGIAFDSANNRMYVTNSGTNNVSVISTATNAVVGDPITVGTNPHGIAFDSANNRMYVTNYLGNTVSVIRTSDNTVIGDPIGVGIFPRGIAFDSANNRMYVANGGSNNVSVISTATNTVTDTITVGTNPRAIAFDSVNNRMYVVNYHSGTVSVISTATNTVIGDPITVGTTPHGIAFDSANKRMYVVNLVTNNVSVISTATNTVVGDPIGVGNYPRAIAFDSVNNRMYVANHNSNNVSVISTATNTVIATITVGTNPHGIAFDSANNRMYVTNYSSNTVSVIDTSPATASGSSNKEHLTRPTFGISHETNLPLVTQGFSFNEKSFDITDNWHTDFEQQTIEIGQNNTFSAKAYAPKGLKTQEFLFGIKNVGDSHNAELGVEIQYSHTGNITGAVLVQKTNVTDPDSFFGISYPSKCMPSDSNEKCITTLVSLRFLEPLQYDIMAIKAIDQKGRTQITYLNEGFDISGDSLNTMPTQTIVGPAKMGLVTVTQNEKYSKYWTAGDMVFERNDFGTFTLVPQPYIRHQDSGEPTTRVHSGFAALVSEQKILAQQKMQEIYPGYFDAPHKEINNIILGNLLDPKTD
jgi:YVTN family beta-propeller protein